MGRSAAHCLQPGPRSRRPRLAVLTCALLLVAWAVLGAVAASPAHAAPATPRLGLTLQSPPSVAAGAYDSYLVRPDGTLWSFGGNIYGELGLGDLTPQAVPTQVGTDTDWAMVASSRGGEGLVMAIKQNGTLWAWGENESYYLGLPATLRLVPTQVGTDTDWANVAVGEEYAVALKSDGTLWAMGKNDWGQLGLGDTVARGTFTEVGTGTDWTTIACGLFHTVALKQDGSLWSWGYNQEGELGLGNVAGQNTPQPVGSAKDWAAIACGLNHTLAVKSGGTLWAWGNNGDGDIGQGDSGGMYTSPVQVGTGSDWVAVAGGAAHSIGLKANGTLWGWGDNSYGALGVGLQSHEFGKTWTGTPAQIDSGTDWATVAAGTTYTLAAKNDGSFVAWGDNLYGQIGVGYLLDRCTPTQVGTDAGWTSVAAGDERAVATRDDGTLWAWQAGSRTPAQVGSARDWAHVWVGLHYSVARKNDGSLWSWGDYNNAGELGVGDTLAHETPTQVGTDTDWNIVSCGTAPVADDAFTSDDTGHTLAVKDNGTLWAWGSNTNGELGLGTADTSAHATPVQVGTGTDWVWAAAGAHCSFAITLDGSLYAWGKNTNGRLGLGDTADRATPTLVGTGWKMV